MIAVEVKLLAKRYHGTPWGTHVNEGQVEWPPSPYRFFRALAATWVRKHRQSIDESTFSRMIDALASAEVSYQLPHYTEAHTRHFMVDSYRPHDSKGKDNTSLIIDAFVCVEEPFQILFDGLTPDEECLSSLRQLVETVPYLGRAESWTEMRVLTEPLDIKDANVVMASEVAPSVKHQRVTLFTMKEPEAYAHWVDISKELLEEQLLAEKRVKWIKKGKDPDDVTLTKKARESLEETFPEFLADTLFVETSTIRGQGWDTPPGTLKRSWLVPNELQAPVSKPKVAPGSSTKPEIIRLGLASAVPPQITEFLHFSEKLRAALMSITNGHPVFSGKSSKGIPFDEHEHTFILPGCVDREGRVHEVCLVADMGYEQEILQLLSQGITVYPWRKKGAGGSGYDSRLLPLETVNNRENVQSFGQKGSPLGTAEVWRSLTPFVPTRHEKKKNSDVMSADGEPVKVGSPVHDLHRLLKLNGYPEPTVIRPLSHGVEVLGQNYSTLSFKTHRRRGRGRRSYGRGFGYEVEFERPVAGPIAVGYGAHFGLGVFQAYPERE